jgi:signal transduction histidine kinase/ActR/RegA family two-component response regulator
MTAEDPAAPVPPCVRDELVVMTYRRMLASTLLGVPFAALMALALHGTVGTTAIVAWLVMRVSLAAVRIAQRSAYLASSARERPVWSRTLLVGLAVDGFVWGLAGVWLVPPDDPATAILMVCALVGVGAVGAFTLQSWQGAATAFLLPLLVPTALFHLAQATHVGLLLGVGLFFFLGLMVHEVRNAQARIVELLQLRDSTARIAAEREEAMRLALRQSGVKSQFLATMSHEMRTPLHGMLGLARQIRAGVPEPLAPQLDLIERSGEHLLTLINDVLDFSRIEAGHLTLKPQPFDLAGLIEEVCALAAVTAEEAGLTLSTRLALPQPCPVRGDPSRLRQILQNLVGNAIKFTEQGSVKVVAHHEADSGRTRIEVIDTGIGIDPEALPRIFDAFAQADGSAARRYGGTGLGLTISREIARAMGGDLVCVSAPRRGSAFTLTLTLPAASAAEFAVPEPVEPVAARLHGRVLLAEDNPVNAMVAEAVLHKLGLEVEVAHNGREAVEAFRRLRPDVVLMDCQMPVMDGFEAARRIREVEREAGAAGERHTPLVALTANALEGDRERSLAAGMDDHLAKPFRQDQLARVLERHLKRVA